jgi:hypothetical protein
MPNKQEKKLPNRLIWLSIDFETVKRRIDRITDQVNGALLKYDSQGVRDFFSQGRKPEDVS